ncbi:hypothetical protein [Methylomonas fluvii]|uniref:Uncharacterized protein n=1 Tax=Methylomonas fluvii TaxID=1854564 RepID=A0ABR9DHY5_9GAMM|nr:hypothetical protein [Methylomonas fluvii]MBD9362687.1 hypothetical protein [Methylomonas fluvii]CAD6875819.1 Coproporphyrinogen III oxidase, oxygen-independent (EC 1.3.99.22) [Methylomonas fluvii]
MTTIGRIGGAYIQYCKQLDEYDAAVSQGKLPVFRSVDLDEGDKLQRAVSTRLICHLELSFGKTKAEFKVDFFRVFGSGTGKFAPNEDQRSPAAVSGLRGVELERTKEDCCVSYVSGGYLNR